MFSAVPPAARDSRGHRCCAGGVIPTDEPLSLPARPAPPQPVPFPLLVTLAPLVAAAVIWFVTGSAFALIFAVLSPVIALASMCDARRTQRKRGAADRAGYEEGLRVLRASVQERHDELRSALVQRTPSAKCILAEPAGAGRWRGAAATEVSLGLGAVSSDVRISGAGEPREHRSLRSWAATLTDAPVTADACGGIAIVGPVALSRALARGVLVQLCFALPPNESTLAVPGSGWTWTEALPHSDHGRPYALTVVECGRPHVPAEAPNRRARNGTDVVVIVAERVEDLPPGCATVVRVEGPHRAVVLASIAHADGLEFSPELVSAEDAARFAVQAREQACGAGLLQVGTAVPPALRLSQMHRPAASGARTGAPPGLECVLGRGERGDVSVDLVRDGPHAVVGGTTGSGKSELLVTWVTSLATRYSPAQVTFLLVDFKGGVAFRPLCALPHCVGLITDLDADEAARTLASLSAELRYRERILGAAQAADVTDPRVVRGQDPLPRLVIVVDEFATMLNAFPQLHALFVDVAARGRSLGVHLILCTQRPAGVVRDALLANCSLRVSLRVNNAADSQAVIGTDAAALLSADLPGRCLINGASNGPLLCQVATTEPPDIRSAAEAYTNTTSPVGAAVGAGVRASVRRPWLDPLPSVVRLGDLAGVHDPHAAGEQQGAAVILGLLDEPERQRYVVARWNPAADGHVLVVGDARSGKTTLLWSLREQLAAAQGAAAQGTAAEVAAAEVTLVPADVEGTWDALFGACRRLETGHAASESAHVLLLDDFDSVCARWEPEHRLEALDMLAAMLRDGPAVGLFVVVCVQRLAGSLQNLTSMCQNVLLLRLPNAAEHQAAGGASAHFDGALPAGGGRWQGLRLQLLCPASTGGPDATTWVPEGAPGLDSEHPLMVVTRGSCGAAARWRTATDGRCRVVDLTGSAVLSGQDRLEVTAAGGGVIVLGDAEAWQTQWALLAALRAGGTLVFEGGSLADYRAVSRRRELPPPLAPGRGHVWAIHPDGAVSRASLRPREASA